LSEFVYGSEQMLEASVIICTFNPIVSYLQRVLQALREQTLPADKWELILVDNASSTPVAGHFDLSWHPQGRHFREEEAGLAAARLCGMRNSSGRILIFVDDDNVLAGNYLAEAIRISGEFPFLGAWGSGAISLDFEAEPRGHLQPFLPWLGLRQTDAPVWSNSVRCEEATPIGAGLCLLRQVGEDYSDFYKRSAIQISGRNGSSLGAHEDFEICYLACKKGLGMGVFPTLKILHLIAKKRVSDDHIIKLVRDATMSKLLLAHKWGETLPRSPFSLPGVPALIINLIRRRGFDRRVFFAETRALLAARRVAMNGRGAV
jgi:glycosyltransferase involved in cell wall biosynthesis